MHINNFSKEIKQNQKNIVTTCLVLLFFWSLVTMGIISFVLNALTYWLPCYKIYCNLKNDNNKLFNWNIYLINSIILNYIIIWTGIITSPLIDLSFYLRLCQILILSVQYKFRNTLYQSFQGQNNNDNIISDHIIVLNQSRFLMLKKYIFQIIMENYDFFKNLDIQATINQYRIYLENKLGVEDSTTVSCSQSDSTNSESAFLENTNDIKFIEKEKSK
ncbi:hypothetical protein CPAV1605_905 [seawater metagenome]|uniref:Uncharacterized protein n=1 Tax=seawater metagenome TaxID=1561972 RepID=A0A5E8CME8_9ZZZZ